ncbi:glycosyltransferase family 39 protein [Microbacterium gorillae]|uniref:glycosyltransferase family 39 protein n=1 Tax=Microbacterium gorillae TaxID=1231063 RepID=UPI00069408C0|nr:glycosyltransferase family 39 protein [Microbacterium gorillae]
MVFEVATGGIPVRRTPTYGTRSALIAVLVVGVATFAVTLIGSWIPSLWGDEAASVLSATRPWPSLFAMLGRIDAVHGVSYVMMHLWVDLFGSSPFSVRFPSAVAIGLCAAALAWIGYRLRSIGFGVLAGVFAAVNPRLGYAGIEARAYAFDALFATLIILVLLELLRRPDDGRGRHGTMPWWVGYGALVALTTATFLYAGAMVAVVGILLVVARRFRAQCRRWLVSSLIGLAVASPVALLGVTQTAQIAFLGQEDRANLKALFIDMWFVDIPSAIIGWTLVLVALIGWWIARKRQPRLGAEVIGVVWAAVPLAAVLALNIVHPDYTPRYLTFGAPAIALIQAAGIVRLWSLPWARWGRVRLLPIAALLALAVIAVPAWADLRTPYAKRGSDWNEVAAVIEQGKRPGDAIVFQENTSPSWRPRLALDTNPKPFAGLKDVGLVTPYQEAPLWFAETRSVGQAEAAGAFDGVTRVWVVQTITGRPRTVGTDGVADLERAGFTPTQHERLNVSDITLYTR